MCLQGCATVSQDLVAERVNALSVWRLVSHTADRFAAHVGAIRTRHGSFALRASAPLHRHEDL